MISPAPKCWPGGIVYRFAGNEVHLFKCGAFLPARAHFGGAALQLLVSWLFLGIKSEPVGILHRIPIYFHAY
jgi:hypothetical protein